MSTVLIIEDEAALTRMMAASLLEAGFTVATDATAEAALARLGNFSPDVIVFNTFIDDAPKAKLIARLRDLAPNSRILDVSLEKNRMARRIIGKTPETPADDLSPRSVDGAKPSLQAGADAVLELPFGGERLVAAVQVLSAAPPPRDGVQAR